MKNVLSPWQFLFLSLAGWVNREQQQIIDFKNAQIRVLLEQTGRKKILLSDDQRRLLAVKGKSIGLKAMRELTTMVTPDTIMRWHRKLVAAKWDYSHQRRRASGRPVMPEAIQKLVLQMAPENPAWGYDRIPGALANLGHKISDSTVGNILRENGIEPVPDRRRQGSWKAFLKAHWESLAAIDFTTLEVWTSSGLTTFYILVAMRLQTRH